MTDAELEDLKAGLAGVTPGPWEFFPPEGGGWREPYSSAGLFNEDCEKVIDCEWASATEVGQQTYRHIARCSPDKIASLIARLEAAESLMLHLRAHIVMNDDLSMGSKAVALSDRVQAHFAPPPPEV
jgi:hypothetical protein